MDDILHYISANLWLKRLLIIIAMTVVVFFILKLVKATLRKRIPDVDKQYKIRKTTNLFGYLLVFIIILIVYRSKLGNVTVALGVAGAGIAFALQEVIVSFAGWLNIMLSNQITVGQRVKIGEISGDIIDIGVLKTTIMEIGGWVDGDLYNGRITSISNNFVFSTPIQNYSSDYPFLWDEIQVPLRLESDQQSARALFTKIGSEVCGDFANRSVPIWNQMKGKYLIEKAGVEPMIFMKFDQNWMTFTLRYVVDFRKRRSTKDILFSRIIDEIKKHDDIIMIATSTLEVTNLYDDESGENKPNPS